MTSWGSQGRPVDDVIAELAANRADDAKWEEGRTFGLVFDGGPSVREISHQAAGLYLHETALNTQAFPSLKLIQSDVVRWTADLLHGDGDTAGFLTSGGTESIYCGVLAARNRAKAERGITTPEIVLPETAHPAFHKAADNMSMVVRKTPVTDALTADLDAMAAAVGPNTALVVGSAPQYPHGLQDPIPEIAALAQSVGANCHVDACMGGFVLPFAEMLGRPVAPFDFRVDGVTTISADVHKLGYAPKGVSVILHRTKESRRYQTFVFDDWLGGFYASPNMQGTRSGLPMACAWAVMQHLGIDGYKELTARTLDNADRVRAAVEAIPGLRVLGDSRFHLVSVTADPDQPGPDRAPIDVFAVSDVLGRKGWYIERQSPPDNLHMTISNTNVESIGQYIEDLEAAVGEAGAATAADRSTTYGTLT